MTNLLDIKKPNVNKVNPWEVSFDKDTYQKRLLEAIIEKKAKEAQDLLRKEKEMVKAGSFKISRNNIKLDNKKEIEDRDEKMELINLFNTLIDEEKDKTNKKIYKKVVHIIEEMAKNVQKDKYYREENEGDEYKKFEEGQIKITGDDQKITISTSNYTKDDINRIPQRLEELNTMDDWTIKQIYKETLANGKLSEKWGAGLGFIDIIRKSNGGKFDYKIEDTEDPKIKKISISISVPKETAAA